MKIRFFDKTKFFNKALFYKMGDYENMKNLLKKSNEDGYNNGNME